MNKKQLFILLVTLFLSLPYPLSATDIPQQLQNMGFTQYNLVSYTKDGDWEYFTFSNWLTKKSGDMITFAVYKGNVKNWWEEKGREKTFLDEKL
jgi:hypothetical protein